MLASKFQSKIGVVVRNAVAQLVEIADVVVHVCSLDCDPRAQVWEGGGERRPQTLVARAEQAGPEPEGQLGDHAVLVWLATTSIVKVIDRSIDDGLLWQHDHPVLVVPGLRAGLGLVLHSQCAIESISEQDLDDAYVLEKRVLPIWMFQS